jgi:16S rRNA (uracil1498-N3)-methyltransferase
MHRFYDPDIATTLALPEEESKHCVRVLRLVEGDEIEVIDGRGTCYTCRITLAHPKKCGVEIVSQVNTEPHWGHKIVIGVSPTKNLDRMEWMTEKVTEMGVDRIIPLLCRYSERKVLKTERLGKIIVSAMKQSLKSTLPQLDEMTPLDDVINMPFGGNRFIAYCDASVPRRLFAREYKPREDTMVIIGPEGDFSREEIDKALAAGFIPVSLGESRLRTETAATFACAMCHTIDMMNE